MPVYPDAFAKILQKPEPAHIHSTGLGSDWLELLAPANMAGHLLGSFDSMYVLRSQLVHRANPRPAQTLVNASVAELARLVSDLLGLELLDEAES